MAGKMMTFLAVRFPGFAKTRAGHAILWYLFETSNSGRRDRGRAGTVTHARG